MKKVFSTLLVLAMMAALMAGCAGQEAQEPKTAESAVTTEQPSPTSPPEESTEPSDEAAAPETPEAPIEEEPEFVVDYPIAGGGEISIWTSFPGNISNWLTTYADNVVVRELEKRTGIHVNFTEVSQQTEREAFNLMCASGDYRDLIFGFSRAYTGGATKGFEDEVIISLNSYVQQYAPDYYRELTASETRMKLALDDNGDMLGIGGFYLDDYSPLTSGIMIRQDWMDALSLDSPTTYDDWHEILTAFKSEYSCDSALFLPAGTQANGGGFVGGFGTAGFQVGARDIGGHFYQRDGIVTSALLDDSYRDYLALMSSWYSEGLIGRDFYLVQQGGGSSEADEIVLTGRCGIFSGKVDYITKYETADTTGEMSISAIKEPVLNDGDVFGFKSQPASSSSVSVSTACENIELAMNWMNYWYTADGGILANYGVEGLTYEYGSDGKPAFTDLLINNPEGLSFGEANRIYLFSVPCMITDASREAVTYSEKESAAVKLWTENAEALYTLPSTSFTADESTEYALLVTDIETYASEEVLKFIIGDRSMDTWQDFVQHVKDMDIDRCIEIQQAALDRFNER